MRALDALGHALSLAGSMTWQILWALILGFLLAAIVQAVVPKSAVVSRLGGSGPRSIALATGLGAASSSCSYAAVALARSLFCKGASLISAMAFEIASTNLVVELGVILAVLIAWQFTLGELVGGPVMIILLAVTFRFLVTRRLAEEARLNAQRGRRGSMEGHAAMDMSVGGTGSVARRLVSARGLTSVSHIFVMEWAAVLRDVALGLLIAGAVAAWVPESFWHSLFFTGHPVWAKIWGPLIGPIVSVLAFVCSIGNVPLAAVLWNGGISFGGVISFLFADLIIVPILLIYRKYYGTRMMLFLFVTFYATMVVAGYVVELLFGAVRLVPAERSAKVMEVSITLNYTTVLNVVFLMLGVWLVVRFVRTGGRPMLSEMGGGPRELQDPTPS